MCILCVCAYVHLWISISLIGVCIRRRMRITTVVMCILHVGAHVVNYDVVFISLVGVRLLERCYYDVCDIYSFHRRSVHAVGSLLTQGVPH